MEVKKPGNSTVVTLSGRVDHTKAGGFEDRLMALVRENCVSDATVVIDMQNVEYMSSVGLRVLMVAAKFCKAEGGNVVIAALNSTMKEIFEISRFDRIFKVYPTTKDALQEIDPDAVAEWQQG